LLAIVESYGLIIKTVISILGSSEIVMANDKVFSQSDKEAIRLQLLASMLSNSNSNFSQKSCGALQNFWQDLFKRTKPLH